MGPKLVITSRNLCVAFIAAGGLMVARPVAAQTTQPADRSWSSTITGSGGKTVNPDGSVTYNSDYTHTNDQSGKSWSNQNSDTVSKTADAKVFDDQQLITGPNGGTLSRDTQGTWVRNGDGSGTFSSVTDATATGPGGKSASWTTDRSGNYELNGQGGHDWSQTATTTGAGGKELTSVDRSGDTFKNPDGSTGFQAQSDRTNANGSTLDRATDGTVTRAAGETTVQSTTDGTFTGKNGGTDSWTTQRDDVSTVNPNGTKTIDDSKTITNSDGATDSVTRDGTYTKNANGTWSFSGGKDVTHTPATEADAHPRGHGRCHRRLAGDDATGAERGRRR